MRFNYIFMYKCTNVGCTLNEIFPFHVGGWQILNLMRLQWMPLHCWAGQILYKFCTMNYETDDEKYNEAGEPKLGIIRDRIYIFTILYVQWIRLHFSARLQVHSSRLVYGLSKNTFLWKRELLKSNVIFQEKTLIANHPKSKNLEFWNANYFKSIANAMFSQRRQ